MKNLRELYLSKNALGKNGDVDWRWLFGPQVSNDKDPYNLKVLITKSQTSTMLKIQFFLCCYL